MTTNKAKKTNKKDLFCPYCDEPSEKAVAPVCGACSVTTFYCPKCRKPVSRENRTCPHCGAEIKG